MARSLYYGKTLFTVLSDGIFLSSRGFSSSSASAISGRGVMEGKAALIAGINKLGAAASDEPAAPMPWVPDPVTGYYRPANRLREIDPADLRQTTLRSTLTTPMRMPSPLPALSTPYNGQNFCIGSDGDGSQLPEIHDHSLNLVVLFTQAIAFRTGVAGTVARKSKAEVMLAEAQR